MEHALKRYRGCKELAAARAQQTTCQEANIEDIVPQYASRGQFLHRLLQVKICSAAGRLNRPMLASLWLSQVAPPYKMLIKVCTHKRLLQHRYLTDQKQGRESSLGAKSLRNL